MSFNPRESAAPSVRFREYAAKSLYLVHNFNRLCETVKCSLKGFHQQVFC